MRFTVLSSNKISLHFINYMPTTRQWEIENQRFGRQYPVFFFSDFLSAQNMVRVIEGKFISAVYRNDLRGNKNYFELTGG